MWTHQGLRPDQRRVEVLGSTAFFPKGSRVSHVAGSLTWRSRATGKISVTGERRRRERTRVVGDRRALSRSFRPRPWRIPADRGRQLWREPLPPQLWSVKGLPKGGQRSGGPARAVCAVTSSVPSAPPGRGRHSRRGLLGSCPDGTASVDLSRGSPGGRWRGGGGGGGGKRALRPE